MEAAAHLQNDELVQQCVEHLRALPFVRRATLINASPRRGKHSIDARLSIRTPDGQHTLACEIRRTHLRKETAQLLVHFAQAQPGLIVLAPAIGRELGDVFEHASINFVDAAGNCHLRFGNRYVARIQGRSGTTKAHSDRGLRAPAYRALLALLVRPQLVDAPSRAIASEAEVSPQTANDLRRRLVEQSIVLHASGHHRWNPGRRKDAISLWLAGFTTSLGPSLVIGRFRAADRDPALLERRIEPLLDASCEWRYGGGAAANRLTGYYRGERTVLYVRNAPSDLSTQLRLVRDASGPVVLARTPGHLALESPDPRCVHPLLVYADLLAEGHDRAHEAAREVHDRFLTAMEQAS
jgi:hypothetical protein